MKKYYSEQEKLCALITEAPIMWAMYYAAIIAMVAMICIFGKSSAGVHLVAATCFLNALVGLTGALLMEYQKELIKRERYPSRRRLLHTLAGAVACAVCCGVLENPAVVQGGGSGLSAVTAKALATLLGSLGFAGAFAALAAEFSAGRAEAGTITKEIFTVTAVKTKNAWLSYERSVEAVDANGKTVTLHFNLSIPAEALYDDLDRCLNLVPGVRFELVSSNIGPGYVSAILEPNATLKSASKTF